ncbi:MAG: glycosyltransferase family 4 protein [Alistipes sp.]|nr:glycosyltransferase family 4 protein [Alistipes sp.]
MKKNVVFFTARDLSNVGGGERMLSIIANKLSDYYNITILTPYTSTCYYELNNNVCLVSMGLDFQIKSFKRKIQYFKIINSLRHWKKSNSYDFFITSSSMAFLLMSFISWKRDSRLYAWMHLSYYHPKPMIIRWLEKYFYKKFNIISINSMDVDVYEKFAASVTLIPNPLPFTSDKKAELIQKRLISVGRLEKGKRFDLLIELCSNIFRKVPEWTLDIYGQDDGEKATLERRIVENGMNGRIRILDPVSDIKSEYLKSSIFVTTTKVESFSLVLLEASECGLPCVAFDVPSGPRDIIDNDYNGYLVTEGDLVGFEEKLVSLLTSDSLRATLGANAVKKAKAFDENSIIKQWKELLG